VGASTEGDGLSLPGPKPSMASPPLSKAAHEQKKTSENKTTTKRYPIFPPQKVANTRPRYGFLSLTNSIDGGHKKLRTKFKKNLFFNIKGLKAEGFANFEF
jgi:hypothetical protein